MCVMTSLTVAATVSAIADPRLNQRASRGSRVFRGAVRSPACQREGVLLRELTTAFEALDEDEFTLKVLTHLVT